MANHVSTDNHATIFCHCPFEDYWIVKALLSRCGFAIPAAVLGIASNLLTILVLQQVRAKSTTEKLLLVLSLADLILPLTHVTRGIYLSLDKRVDEFKLFRILLFYLWHVFSVVSILLTLLMATRRYIAIAYPHLFQSACNWKRTEKMIWAVGVFAAALFVPVLFHNANPQRHDPIAHHGHHHHCTIDTSREILYVSVIIATLRLKNNFLLAVSYWLYVFVFLLLCPFVLALLSIRFTLAISKKITSTSVLNPKLARANAKTKLILIVSLMSLVRDLPLGLLTLSYVFFEPVPACLTTMRLLAKELTITLSATNFVVLYFTNENFKKALLDSRLCSRYIVKLAKHGKWCQYPELTTVLPSVNVTAFMVTNVEMFF